MHVVLHFGTERADGSLELHLVRDDVVPNASVDSADRNDGGSLRDIELASAFARQAAVAIRSSRLERDTATLLTTVLASLGAGADEGGPSDRDIEAVVAAAVADLDSDEAEPLWALADQVARIRAVDPAQLDLVRELLAVLVGRADRGRSGRSRPR